MSDLTREDVDNMTGLVALEFGASWCGFCQGARPRIDRALKDNPEVRHIWVEDGKGKRLGRTYGVKLWPTLVLLRDGQEIVRVIRPDDDDLRAAFSALS